jgi:flavin reductase
MKGDLPERREADGVDRGAFREAMSRLGASVHIITSAGPAGVCGITASAVCSVSDTPPTLLVCLNRQSAINPVFKANGVFCINTLAADHQALSEDFAGSTGLDMRQRMEAAQWRETASGAPALTDALVSLDCRITEVNEVGTHSVFFGEVLGLSFGVRRPALVYLHRTYHSL